MKPELKRAYDSGKLILFAGAGISRNLGLPEWHELQFSIPMATTFRWRNTISRKRVRWDRYAAGWIVNGIDPILTSEHLKSTP